MDSMDLDDDPYDDDFELTDEVLNALQNVENQYTLQTASQALSQSQPQPPPPRPATSNAKTSSKPGSSWRQPKPIPRRPAVDLDDMPDITLDATNNWYAVEGSTPRPSTSLSNPRAQATKAGGSFQTNRPNPIASGASSSRETRLNPQSRPSPQSTRSNSHSRSGTATPPPNASRGPHPLAQTSIATRNTPPPQPTSTRTPSNGPQQPPPQELQNLREENSQKAQEIAALQALVKQMQAQKESTEKEVQAARDLQLIREGEISTLRRNMEKQAAAHADTLAKLRMEKLDVEKKRAALEMEMKAEMDRLKTKFSFKQQEYESSMLRFNGPPSTARRGKRVMGSQMVSTPGPSRQNSMFINNRGDLRALAPASQALPDTPLMPQRRHDHVPEDDAAPVLFPGFNDSFARRPPRSAAKPVQKETSVQSLPETIPGTPPPFDNAPIPLRATTEPLEEAEEEEKSSEEDGTIPDEDLDIEPPVFQWSHELFRLMFTCTAPAPAPIEPRLVVQTLLSTSFIGPSPAGDAIANTNTTTQWRRYQTASAELLTLFSRAGEREEDLDAALDPAENADYKALVHGISSALLTMLDALVLGGQGESEALYAVLYLVHSLIILQPTFCDRFLTLTEPRGLTLALGSILTSYRPQTGTLSGPSDIQYYKITTVDRIGLAALTLAETLAWNASDDSGASLAQLIDETESLASLLEASQPFWLITRTVQLLTICAMRPNLVTPLLTPVSEASEDMMPNHSPAITRMCAFLSDPGTLKSQTPLKRKEEVSQVTDRSYEPTFGETWDFIASIMTFFVSLGQAHEKGPYLLENFPTFAASVLACVASMCNLVFEEHPFPFSSPNKASFSFSACSASEVDRVITTLIAAIQLLHRWLYVPATVPGEELPRHADLSYLLRTIGEHVGTAQPEAFHALDHTFIVSMARLGYADFPDWLGQERIKALDDIAELARELLELFVGGPDADLIVEAYISPSQEEPDPAPVASKSMATVERELQAARREGGAQATADAGTRDGGYGRAGVGEDDEGSDTEPPSEDGERHEAMDEDVG
ncbi:hypothetical protein DL93DRAFT_2168045 [Clavulina sp. PMI_390]|nr:hypothetical protein DL93DRAFT_2168045 [Clavulina sp. PMI_390]